MSQVQFPIKITFSVLDRWWEGNVEIKIIKIEEKLRETISFKVRSGLEKVIEKRIKPYIDSDIEKSIERIERVLKEKHNELFSDVYEFISKYDKPLNIEKVTIERDKYSVRVKHEGTVLFSILPFETDVCDICEKSYEIGALVYGDFSKAVDEVLSKLDSHLRFEKKMFKLLDEICVVEAEVDSRPYESIVEINVGGFIDVMLPRGYVVKPGSKIIVNCKYRRDELHREIPIPTYALLELWERKYAKEVW